MGTLLLIDPSAALADVLGDVLQRELGYTTVRAKTCAAAWHLLQHRAFQVILLDLQDPGSAELGFCDQLQAAGQMASIPLIVFTTKPDDPQLRQLSMSALIAKPFNLNRLLEVVRALA